MTALVRRIVVANSVNLTQVKDLAAGVLKGWIATNTTAAAIFLKFYWYQPTPAAPVPTVGTTVPDLTITIPALGTTTGTDAQSFPDGMQRAGQLWLAVTNLPADNDATAVAAGSGIITVLYE